MEIGAQSVIAKIEIASPTALGQLEAASGEAARLVSVADDVVSHFVWRCRESGHSWSEIGERLGVTKQAAQHRFVAQSAERSGPRGVREHTGKYRPLWLWLRAQTQARVDLSFAEVEAILGFELPPSSRTHPPHWHGYKGSAVARAIIDAGWRSRDLNLTAERVTFVRAS